MEFRHRLRKARKNKNLTQEQLAEKVGVTQAAIQSLESGRVKSTPHILKISRILEVSPDWLENGIGQENLMPPPSEAIKVPLLRWSDLNLTGQKDEIIDKISHILKEKEKKQEVYPVYFREEDIKGKIISALKAEQIDAMIPRNYHPLTIDPNEYLIIEYNRAPREGSIVLAKMDKGIAVRQYVKDGTQHILKALNEKFPNIEKFEVLGVVIGKSSYIEI